MFNKYKGILKIIPKNICITKKEFCDIINSMKEIDGRFEEITKVLGETFAINGPITINDKLYRNILTFLKILQNKIFLKRKSESTRKHRSTEFLCLIIPPLSA